MKTAFVLSLIVMSMFTASSTPTDESISMLKGMFEGTFGTIKDDLKECTKDGKDIIEHVRVAVRYFNMEIESSIKLGFYGIGLALDAVPREVENCKNLPNVVKNFKEIAMKFKAAEQLVINFEEDIQWFGKSIHKNIHELVSGHQDKDFYTAGHNLGAIIKVALAKLDDPIIDVENFLEGFFKGALHDDSVDINGCITDAANVLEEIEKMINELIGGGIVNPEKFFLDFIDLITDSVKSVAQCEKSPPELMILLDWATQMKDINVMETKLFKAFLYYPQRLKDDIKNTIDGFQAHTYDISGHSLGDILYILFKEIN